MKKFFSQYSYSIIKMFVYQFAISLFGSLLSMVTSSMENNVLSLVISVLAIVFYMFLIYTMTWEVGAKDKISVDVKKKEYRPRTGLYMALFANIPNFLVAIIYTIVAPLANSHSVANNFAIGTRIASIVIDGMYLGVITTVRIGGQMLQYYWWTYFLITVPAIVTAWIAYWLGHRNFRFFGKLTQNK